MSDEKKLLDTAESKELTDKIHRLVRKFSRELAELVAVEIGARAPKIYKKRGPPKGYKMPRGICPVCQSNPNTGRTYGFICKDCRAGLDLKHRQPIKQVLPHYEYKKKDRLGKDYQVRVKVPKHREKAPGEVVVPAVEPDFLDRLPEIPAVSPPEAPALPKTASPAAKSEPTIDLEFPW